MGDHRYDVLEDHREKRERRRQCELIHGAFHHGDLALDPFQTRLSARLDEGDDVCAGEDGRGLREWLCRTALRATGGLVSGCISRLMWRWSRLSSRRGDGVIDRLSSRRGDGVIDRLSSRRGDGVIDRLSSRRGDGVIDRLSSRRGDGVIDRLSSRRGDGVIDRLSSRRGDGVTDRLMWRWSRLIDSSFTNRNRGESLGRWQHCLLRNLVTRDSDNHSLSCTQCSDFGKQCRQ